MKTNKIWTSPRVILVSAMLCLAALLLVPTINAAPSGSSSSSAKASKVDVNNADVSTLQTLPGVGPAIAQKIVDNRPYKSYADLEKVSGLSKAKVNAMKGQITFGSSATAKAGTSHNKNLAPTGKVNINTASAEELDSLPGIGPAHAQAIIDYRNQHGNFKSIDEIKNVKGIKEGEFSKLQEHISVR